MKILDILVGEINIPLIRPFKTALRTTASVNDIVVKIVTDTEHAGYGGAAQTAVITGDTKGSIVRAVKDFIKPSIVGMDIENLEGVMIKLHNCIVKNTSAKAAVDMAVYDLLGKLYNTPLYKLLGGYRNEIKTDLTISVNTIDEMVRDSMSALAMGYDILKIKVGNDAGKDIQRVAEIRKAVGDNVIIRIDANQGWSPKESVRIIRRLEDMGLNVELIEQPVKAMDIMGLKFVTDNVLTPILADESVFSANDAIEIIRNRAADFINIKLMKTGGIYNALKICAVAEIYNVECMMGCMLESQISVSAEAHLACSKNIVTMADLDGPGLCVSAPFAGGPEFRNAKIVMNESPGIGFKNLENVDFL